jgi:hypothetical protein
LRILWLVALLTGHPRSWAAMDVTPQQTGTGSTGGTTLIFLFWMRTERSMQQMGSLPILLSVAPLLMAFISEPAMGIVGRSWRSYFGVIALFAGVMMHTVARKGVKSF